MNNIKVTVLISTYNWPEVLEVILRSLSAQTLVPEEVVVADDGSTDDTRKLIEKLQQEMPFKIVHVWQKNEGFRVGQIRNKGIAAASGNYIIQIDGDMVPEKHFVEDHLSVINENCFTVGSRVNTTAELAQKIISTKKLPSSIFANGIVNRLNAIRIPILISYYKFRYKQQDTYYTRGCNMAYWRKDIIDVNGYNEDMTGWGREDSELAIRLLNLGRKKQFIKFGAVAYHVYHTFKSRERETINIGILENTIKNNVVVTPNGVNKYSHESQLIK